jgi:hypothetical protein
MCKELKMIRGGVNKISMHVEMIELAFTCHSPLANFYLGRIMQ